MKKVLLATIVAGTTLLSANDIVVGAKVGTLGFGVEGVQKYSNKIDFRLAGNYYKYNTSGTEDGINYNIDLKLATFGIIADCHPFSNGFVVSGGLYYNGNDMELDAQPNTAVTIGNTSYATVTSIKADVDFNSVAPYLGIGYSNATAEKGWSFSTELGVLFQGKPDVSLSVSGTGIAAADIAKEESNLEDDLSSLEYYPVLSVGFRYRF